MHRGGGPVPVLPAQAHPVTWTEYTDDDGNTYFYNSETCESVWELPDGVVAQKGEEDADLSAGKSDEKEGTGVSTGSNFTGGEAGEHWLSALDEAYSIVEMAKREDEVGNTAAAVKAYGAAGDAFLKILAAIPDAKGTGKYSMIEAQVEATIKRGRELKRQEAALQDRAEMEKKKRPVVQEFVKTEETYNTNLRALLQHYVKPLHENLMSLSPVVDEAELSDIFQNVEDILRHSDALLDEIRGSAAWEKLSVAAVLQRNMKHVGVYRQYVTNLDKATKRLQQLIKDKPEFEDFVKNIASDHASSSRTRGDGGDAALVDLKPVDFYLIEPFQRVLRYKMLIERLLSCTNKGTEAEEFQGLQGALASVGSVATAMNQAKREAEQRENLRRIEAALAAQGVVCGGKCLKQGLVCLVKSGSSSSSSDVGVGKGGSGGKGLWGLVGGGSKGGGDGGEERWAYLFDDGLVCSEGTKNAAEQAGFFSPDKGLGGGIRWGHMTSVKEVEGGEGGKEFVIEYGGRAELMRGANASVAGEWVAELRRTRLRVAVSEQVEAGRSLEQVFNDFDRDNDGGLDRSEMHAALRSVGLELKDGDVAGMMRSMDRDGDGRVSYTEFCEGVEQYGGLRRRKGKTQTAVGGDSSRAPQWGRMVVKPKPPRTPKPPTTMAVKLMRAGGCLCCMCTACGFLALVLFFMMLFFIFEPIVSGFREAFEVGPQ